MRYGLLADIHANLPALTAAIRSLARRGVDRWLCAGDVVGYGPWPNECVAALAELDPVCIAGNHELIALGELTDQRCGPRARESLAWTGRELTEDSRRYLAALPGLAELPGLVMAHGALADPERYIRRADQAGAQLDELATAHPDARVLVLGHTHRAWLYRHGAGDQRGPRLALTSGERYLVNPGAVGQSRYRERRPLARFALLDLPDDGGEGSVELFAVPYDDAAARSALQAVGLPADNVHLRPSLRSGVKRRVLAAFR